MTADAETYMRRIGEMFAAADFRTTMTFDAGHELPVHAELLALKLIRRHGTSGNGFMLTEAGIAWVMENRN